MKALFECMEGGVFIADGDCPSSTDPMCAAPPMVYLDGREFFRVHDRPSIYALVLYREVPNRALFATQPEWERALNAVLSRRRFEIGNDPAVDRR